MGYHKPGKWLGLLASEWTLGAMTRTLQCTGQTFTTKSYRPHLSGLRNLELVQTPHLQESRQDLHGPRPEADSRVPPSEADPPSYLCESAHKTPVPQSQSFRVQRVDLHLYLVFAGTHIKATFLSFLILPPFGPRYRPVFEVTSRHSKAY